MTQDLSNKTKVISAKIKNVENKKIAVIDFETDPFKWGRIPKPFAAGFFDGVDYAQFWGEDCAFKLINYIINLDGEYLIYAHNGGKFDFYFLMQEGVLDNPVKIINGRIVLATLGPHELRDSYAIIPIPLASYKKDEIDYKYFESDVRLKHKKIILEYLKNDCVYLFELVQKFIERFGVNLTIGGTAIKKLQESHPFKRTSLEHDERYRPYYYGGRVECYKHGVFDGDFKIFDVNSMYPYVMKNYDHPIGVQYVNTTGGLNKDGTTKIFGDMPYFIYFTGINNGALPVRTKQGLNFTITEGEFFACSHEIKVALKYDLIKIKRIHKIVTPVNTLKFDTYVDTYMQEKINCKDNGDRAGELFAKLLLNSAYGKFGQNPEHYFDFYLRYMDEPIPSGYELYLDYGGIEVWRTPVKRHNYYDVAVAASVTSAARSVLLDALQNVTDPIYCDTDSIICSELKNVKFHDSELGAWKLEGAGNSIALAGKKLYALRNGDKDIKIASKGVVMKASDIFAVAHGGEYHALHDAPNFKLTGEVKFTDRRINITKRLNK